MDWSNKEVINNPNLSYTSRDYSSIYEELMAAIPKLTKLYDPKSEADPGVVLIKAMSMLGDMLSYNLDNNALEAYPKTVLQRKNAQQIFRLMGYKMKWYRSARCLAYFTNANAIDVNIDRYNIFTSMTGIKYTNLEPINIPAGLTGTGDYSIELTQGTPITPSRKSKTAKYAVAEWHDAYNYNVDATTTVINNRMYLSHTNVDGSTIVLVDNDQTQFADVVWRPVENMNTITEVGKYFEFDYDENGSPFIQLPEYWNTRYAITKFKLFYVISDGSAGEIVDNSLSEISSSNVSISGVGNSGVYLDNVKIYNQASTYGYSPETPAEARKSAELYINTMDTLVVLDDFTKALKRITGVANAIATDCETDPDGLDMLNNQINLYIIRKPGYDVGYEHYADASSDYYMDHPTQLNDDIWKASVIDELESYKHAKYDMQVRLENHIDWIEWTIAGSIWLRQPVPVDKNHQMMVAIQNNLDHTFSPSKLDFNEAINYIDVIDNIKASDKLIYHVDLDSDKIKYSRFRRGTNGNPTGKTVQRKWRIYEGDINSGTGVYTNYYTTGLTCVPTPGGDGVDSGVGFRIFSEGGSSAIGGLGKLTLDYDINEFEIYNYHLYSWVQEERIDTGYYIQFELDADGNAIDDKAYLVDAEGNKTPYYFVEFMPILLSDNLESGDYIERATRDGFLGTGKYMYYKKIEGADMSDLSLFISYDIYVIKDEYGDWTRRFIDRNNGEIYIIRGNVIYSTQTYYNEKTGEILDRFGDILIDPESGAFIQDPVAKEELTGRYEQTLLRNEFIVNENGDQVMDPHYEFYLGQTADGYLMEDSIGNPIVGFPIKPNGFHVFVDTDRYVIHDSGNGVLLGSPGVLKTPGSIDYTTGKVSFDLAVTPRTDMKIVYFKNNIAMARYNEFDVNKFYTQPQFLRYPNANRSQG